MTPETRSRVEKAADRAFDSNRIVTVDSYVIVPDVLLVEAAANGLSTPHTWRLIRRDGRSAFLYRLPAAAA